MKKLIITSVLVTGLAGFAIATYAEDSTYLIEASPGERQLVKEKAKISVNEAVAIAVKERPGTVKKIEFDTEENGDPSYEVKIINAKGEKAEVAVNAVTGKIIDIDD
jgi:uncharacterized membrane protein YkoI